MNDVDRRRSNGRRMQDHEREALLQLTRTVAELSSDRVTTSQFTQLQAGHATLREAVQRVEISLWGATGQNGINSEVRGIRKELAALDDRLDEKFDELGRSQVTALTEQITRFRNAALAIFTTVLLIAATLLAAFH